MGVKDFGIVNLISGIVAMLSFMQNSMTVSSQRFMSVHIAKKDDSLMTRVFNSSFVLHFILALIILIVLECLTPIVFGSSIQIPEDRETSAQILYQLTIIGTALVIITVPYDAALNAHENMLVYSFATIIESLIRLAGAFILLVWQKDKLIFYGCLLITIRLVSLIIKSIYCRKHYKETHISAYHRDHILMKKMFSFAFWSMFGALAFTGRSQGVAIVMNIFYGVIVNAAYGIASQISGQLQNFTATISKAMNPQIMQRAGIGNNDGMISLSLKQCKYSSILLSYAVIPLVFSMPFILKIWLNEIPRYCIAFSSLILVVSMIQQTSSGLMSLVQAVGKVKNYHIVISIIMLLNIPIAYILLKIGFSAPMVIVGMIAIEIIVCMVRVYFAHKLAFMPINAFFKDVIIPIVLLYIISCTLLEITKKLIFTDSDNFISFIVLTGLAFIIITITTYFTLSNSERTFIMNIIKKRIIHNRTI